MKPDYLTVKLPSILRIRGRIHPSNTSNQDGLRRIEPSLVCCLPGTFRFGTLESVRPTFHGLNLDLRSARG